jgi:hypothetical protein
MAILWLASCSKFAKEQKFIDAVGRITLSHMLWSLRKKGVWRLVKARLPKEMWHEKFADHGVIEVKQYFNGAQVVLEKSDRDERGVYITTDKSQAPENGSGVTFERVSDGIYWFEQRNSDEYIPPGTTEEPR